MRKNKNTINVNDLLKFNESYFSLPNNNEKEFDINDYKFVPELNIIVKKIQNIFSTPKTYIQINKEKKITETAVRIDNEAIKETLKKPGNLLIKNNELIPERIYTNDFDIDYGIYENKFIVLFIDKLIFFINSCLKQLLKQTLYLSKNYQINNTNISISSSILKYSNINNKNYFKNNNFKKKSLLTYDDNDLVHLINDLTLIKQKLTALTSTKFYKTVRNSKSITDKEIHPTNILKENELYAPCYSFYLKLNTLNKAFKYKPINNRYYYNCYVLKEILKQLKKDKFKFSKKTIKLRKKKIVFNKFKMHTNLMLVTISMNKNNIELLFKLKSKNKNNTLESITNKISLDLYQSFKDEETSTDYINKKINLKLRKGFNNAYVITQSKIYENQNVIVCSPYRSVEDFNVKNLIASCYVFTECNKFLYHNMCPVCGSPISLDENESNKTCYVCNSSFSIIQYKNNNIIWIKRLEYKD